MTGTLETPSKPDLIAAPHAEAPKAASPHTVRCLNGELKDRLLPITSELVIGRSTTCDVFIPDRRLSRRHARLFAEDDRLLVEDLDSHNGTYVNGKRVSRAQLYPSDVVRVGTSKFEVTAPEEESSSPVRVVGDTQLLQAQLVKRVEPQMTRSLRAFQPDELFSEMGIGETDRYAAVDGSKVEFLVQQTRNFATLHEISKALQSEQDPQEMLEGVMDLVLRVVNADRGYVALLDEQGELIPQVVRVRQGASDEARERGVTISATVAEQVLKGRNGVITSDASSDARFASAQSVVINEIRSLLAVPILVGSRVTGLIEVENTRSITAFTENDLDLLCVVASTLGVALDNLWLARQREATIAELKEAQAQLIATQDRLVRAEQMAVVGRLASGIAHEVKNHLAPFMLADMIAQQYPDDEEIQEAAELMLEAQRRILSLVDEIRQFALGARTTYDIAPHDLCGVLNGVLRFVRCDAAVKKTQLSFEPTVQPVVDMDAGRMRQVFINLIRNAADAMKGATSGVINVYVAEVDGEVIIEVKDNGKGIPEEARARVFEPFFTTKGDKGIGLGLDISRKIIVAHRGTLTFDTEVDVGTTFRIVMPTESPLPVESRMSL